MSPLAGIAIRFAVLSLVAVGGVTAVIPEVHRIVVDVHHWASDAQFTQMFVIARAAPGPNMLMVTLIGWQVAGLPGALVATAAMVLPSCTLTYLVSRVWERFRAARWRVAIEAGLAPIAVGLVIATGWIVARGAQETGWLTWAVTALTTALVLVTRLNPLWLFVAAGALGLFGAL